MSNMREKLDELKRWKEVTKGLYRYVVAANACYEIHILYHAQGTDILTAKASLYIVGEWRDGIKDFFERECLLSEQPVFECLKAAQKDNDGVIVDTSNIEQGNYNE